MGGGGGDIQRWSHYPLHMSMACSNFWKQDMWKHCWQECFSLEEVSHSAHSDVFSEALGACSLSNPPTSQQLEEMTVADTEVWHLSHCLLYKAWVLNPCHIVSLPSFPGCNKNRSTLPRRETSGVYFWSLTLYKILPSGQKTPTQL